MAKGRSRASNCPRAITQRRFTRVYAGLAVAYARLIRGWLRHGDGEISDAPALEFYLNQPGRTAPESLLTKICLAVTLA
jgi:DNA gyrase inhibitor GyrI